MSIPKVIHYCWFGDKKKTQLVEECISSWKKYLPDYEIIEWNEKNTDLNHSFIKRAYIQKKWAFVSDIVRFQVLFKFGGIYLDTDMLILRSLDGFLDDNCFFGAENEKYLNAAIIGTVKNHPFIKECLLRYENVKMRNETNWSEFAVPRIITKVYRNFYNFDGFFKEKIEMHDIISYPSSYFYSLNFDDRKDVKNYKCYLTVHSHAVHLWNASWIEPNEFHYLRKKQYSTGIKKIVYNIISNRKISFFYFRKILSSLKESLNPFKNKQQ